MRATFLVTAAAFILGIVSLGVASGQTPPGPTTLSTVNFAGVTMPAQAELVQEVIDFAPRASTPTQTRGGDLFVTVMEGQVVLRRGSADFYYAASSSSRTFRVARGEVHSIRNVNGSNKARIFASTILATGNSLTTDEPGPAPTLPAPVVAMTSKATPTSLPSQISVLQIVWEFQPGAATAAHSHHGFFLVTVTEGELGRLRVATGQEDIIRAGGQFIETPEQSYDAIVRNSSPAVSRNVFTVLTAQVPPSTNLPSSSAHEHITPPSTGSAGLATGITTE